MYTQKHIVGLVFVSSLFDYCLDMTILGHFSHQCNTHFQRGRECLSYGKVNFVAMGLSDALLWI